MEARASRLLFSNLLSKLSQFPESPAATALISKSHFSSIPNAPPMRGGGGGGGGDRRTGEDDPSEDLFLRSLNFGGEPSEEKPDRPPRGGATQDFLSGLSNQNERPGRRRMPGRPTRGAQREEFEAAGGDHERDFDFFKRKSPPQPDLIGKEKGGGLSGDTLFEKLNPGKKGAQRDEFEAAGGDHEKDFDFFKRKSPPQHDLIGKEKGGGLSGDTLFEKLNLGKAGRGKKEEEAEGKPSAESPAPEPSLQDADAIFKKMKETGLIPNAVAMLDGLCKDGLIQEAMKLFGLMREKGTIPEVVIYTAVVEGFCKAAKFDDAKRIFRKMQKNGIEPNAFSYTVLVQELCKGKRLEDAVEFCMEMLDAGHSPNPATFTGLVDGFCKEKGAEEAESFVRRLRERGFAMDEKAVREHMDKKGPFSPMVWEAIFGKKTSHRPL